MGMKEIIAGLTEPLTIDDVELRVGVNSEKSFTILLYKTARTDRRRLDKVCPAWGNKFRQDDNKNVCCAIEIWDEDSNSWISREDVGTPPNTEKEKGSYSDAFKRSGYKWGIGEELYHRVFKNIRIMWKMKKEGASGREKYKPIDFWQNKLAITKYEVKDGIPSVEITYDGMQIFPVNKSKSKGKKSHSVKQGNALVTVEQLKYLRAQLGGKDLDDTYLTEQFDIDKLELLEESKGKDALQLINDFEPETNIEEDIPI